MGMEMDALETSKVLTTKGTELSLKLNRNATSTTIPNSHISVHPNCEPFNCPICRHRFAIGEGIILIDCLHEFCRKCIVAKIHQNQVIRVNCPFDDGYKCQSFLSEREIRGLVTEDEYKKTIRNNQVTAREMEVDELVELEDQSISDGFLWDKLVRLRESTFQCPRCLRMSSGENGIILKICEHSICKECIVDHFFKNQKYRMNCEFKTNDRAVCGHDISEKEIRAVLNEIGLDGLYGTKNPNSSSNLDGTMTPLTRNKLNFFCGICYLDCPTGEGVKLDACSHHVCEACLCNTIRLNSEPEILCPYSKSYESCAGFLSHSEIKSLTSVEEYRKFKQIAIKKATEPSEFFLLTMMDELRYIQNTDTFDCPICFVPCNAFEGIKLRDCLHQFCLECFTSTVTHSEDESIKCPFTDENLSHCESFFQEREIRAVVSMEIYNKFLERKLKFAEHSITNTFHCKTIDCAGFGIIEEGDNEMICSICRQQNCLKCKAIHQPQTCEDYQDSLTGHFQVTERYINTLKDLGDVMNCPKCEALIHKIAGCSWLQCTFCKTEICWATKGPRWGLSGKGDLSGGCRCKLNGIRCHPRCENCH